MITCNLMGGLGNQIFQIFTTISYALRYNIEYKFTDVETLGGGSTTLRKTYWETFFSKLKSATTNMFPELMQIKETDFAYNDLNLEQIKEKDILLFGYFQSDKYFKNEYSDIYELIEMKQIKQRVLQSTDYTSDFLSNAISMHFRIGDYKKIQYVHPIMTYEYYEKSLNYIKLKDDYSNISQILYFCEDVDLQDVNEIIFKLESKFPNFTFIRCHNKLEDWEQLVIMSLCYHNIIANSSFSWWGAYFNSNEEKIVCFPSTWFGPTVQHNTKDLCPIEWTKIEC